MSSAHQAYTNTAKSDADRNALVEDYLPLVRHVIGRLPLSLPNFMDHEDLFEVGVLGLMNAARSYDPGKGAQFKTHAYVNIRGAVLDELRRHDVLPRSRRDRIRLFKKTSEDLELELGRQATSDEIAQAMGLSVEQVDDVLVNMQGAALLSLDDSPGDEDSSSLSSVLSCMATPEPGKLAEDRELLGLVAGAIEELPENERHVIVLYYSEGLLLKEIGAVLGVSESRVSQIHSRAIFKLNKSISANQVAS